MHHPTDHRDVQASLNDATPPSASLAETCRILHLVTRSESCCWAGKTRVSMKEQPR